MYIVGFTGHLPFAMYADICNWHSKHSPVAPASVSEPRRIFIVDDHPLMRRGYNALVQLEPDLLINGEAEGGYEALEKLYDLETDLVITDVSMSDLNGYELTRRIKGVWKDLPVLVASSYESEFHAPRARKVGARGYIEKGALSDIGLNVIRCALTQQACSVCPYLLGQ